MDFITKITAETSDKTYSSLEEEVLLNGKTVALLLHWDHHPSEQYGTTLSVDGSIKDFPTEKAALAALEAHLTK